MNNQDTENDQLDTSSPSPHQETTQGKKDFPTTGYMEEERYKRKYTTNFEIVKNESNKKSETPKLHDKKKIRNYVLIGISIVAASLISYAVYSLYDQHEKEKQAEEAAFSLLDADNYRTEDYQMFLDTYPRSEHSKEVKKRLTRLKNMEVAWKQIANSNNINKFVDFKNIYRDPFYSKRCDQKIDSLDWCKAKKQNTPESYKIYLDVHPNGTYLKEAEEARLRVAYMDINEQEKEHIQAICKDFFSSLSVNDRMGFCVYLAENLDQFVNMTQISRIDVLYWAEDNVNSHHFINYKIDSDVDILKLKNDRNEDFYKTQFLLQEATTDESGNEYIRNYNAEMEFNRKFQIYSLKLNEN